MAVDHFDTCSVKLIVFLVFLVFGVLNMELGHVRR
jgi:hypothetical protein